MNGWPQVDLEEISDISAGNPAPQDANHFCVDGHPFVRMQDVGRKHIDPALVETTDRVSPLAIRECGLRLYPAGTLLIPKSGASVNLNHRAMLGQDAYVVSHLATMAMFHLTFPPAMGRMRVVKEIGHETRPFRRPFP